MVIPFAWCEEVTFDGVPKWGDVENYGAADVGGVVVVSVADPDELSYGFMDWTLWWAVQAALDGRTEHYDSAMFLQKDRMDDDFDGALAFHWTLNRDVQGIGEEPVESPEIPVGSVLWMNGFGVWDQLPAWYADIVFTHELGHTWLSYPLLDHDDPEVLLGRQRAHWSYFADTSNSPMEGNAWIDRGDGTFAVDLDDPVGFSPLDMYLMGLAGPGEVPPFFVIEGAEPIGVDRDRESSPEVEVGRDVVVTGTRRDVSVGEIVAANGERIPPYGDAPTDFRVLTVVVLGPGDALHVDELVAVHELQQRWAHTWREYTWGRSTVEFVTAQQHVPPDWGDPPVPLEAR